MALTDAEVTWAVPVRPDLLIGNLKVYGTAVKTLRSIRLCHRFGQGPQAHIKRLPTEIESLIEEHILEHFHAKASDDAIWCFRHFEGRCEPVDHLEGGYEDIFEDAKNNVNKHLCKKCKQTDGECSGECQADCRKIVEAEMNKGMDEVNNYDDICEPEREQWESMIDQAPKGAFVKGDKALMKHFGLDAHFATARAGPESKGMWTEDPNHYWRRREELQTTICYLTLPIQASEKAEYDTTAFEKNVNSRSILGLRSCFVEVPDIQVDDDARVKQFHRALRLLKLEPYIHPSQLNNTVSGNTSYKKTLVGQGVEGVSAGDAGEGNGTSSDVTGKEFPAQTGTGEKGKHASDKNGKEKQPTKPKWPRMVMLVHADFDDD